MNDKFEDKKNFACLVIDGLENRSLKDKRIKELQDEIAFINNQIRDIPKDELFKLFEKLDYPTAKYLFHELIYSVMHDKNSIDELTKLLNEKELEAFPELRVAHYFPMINTLDYLSDEEKRELDKFLFGQSVNRALMPQNSFDGVVRSEYYNRVYEDICRLGICEKRFDLIHADEIKKYEYDEYNDYFVETVGEAELKNIIKSFEVADRIEKGIATKEDKVIASRENYSPYLYLPTEEVCGEITSLAEFNEKVIKKEKYAKRKMSGDMLTINTINSFIKIDEKEFFIRLKKQLSEK
ncbi:hypothetical protein C4D27_16660 [Clostridium perfringens]